MNVLVESAAGYALFALSQTDSISLESLPTTFPAVQKQLSLLSFLPFRNAAHALENINAVSEGVVHPHLKELVVLNCVGKELGVGEPHLAGMIKGETGYVFLIGFG